VADAQADPSSLLNLVRTLIELRRSDPALGATGDVEIINPGYPFVYRRGGKYTIAVHPAFEPAVTDIPVSGTQVLGEGTSLDDGRLRMDGFSYAVFAD
jgi:maltose alpha-D-glucosyltransferase/alpha-amylase